MKQTGAADIQMDGHGTAALEARALRRVYRTRGKELVALDGVSLTVARREWVALLGPNGSGKSTLLRMAATIDCGQAESGALSALGWVLPAGARAARERIGVVFQNAGLDALLTVEENLRLQGALYGMQGAALDERVAQVADKMGVRDRLADRVGTLSGGLARRVDLARALLSEPELLLLDEPTSGLDLEARGGFLRTVEQARAERPSLTVVMTTHMMDEAERADRVVMLCEGKVVGEGTPEALRNGVGARLISTEARWERHLRDAGLAARAEEGGGRVVGTGDAGAVERAVTALMGEGAAFTVGPPTLGDAYLAATGRGLSDAGGAP